ncbi:hypothetical protein [Viridibacterium curvum]|uniref:Uncharacterized protein n=1 Tax=Viridibacterium curvum TaxID=1101404 RepID=A0ABP9QF82_9RHOO
MTSPSSHANPADRAVANLLRLLRVYVDGELCLECEERVSAAVCRQMQCIAQSQQVGPATRESCMDLLDHWLRRPEERIRFNTTSDNKPSAQSRSSSHS